MKDKPNVLIITFDCLRPDHLGGSGYKGVRTPTFDRLIDEGIFFLNAYSQAPNTWISHASLFTGCNPYRHGVRTPLCKISTTVRTMAEVFREADYSTFGLPGMSLLNREVGFSRGFNKYCLDGLQSTNGLLSHRYNRSASDTLAITKNWLKSLSRPFFGWIHYFGLHKLEDSLLNLPTKYRRQYSAYAQYYDGKVAFADEQFLKPLIDQLEALETLDRTILVLWSDHGENLHELEYSPQAGHNWSLTEDVMRIPLVIRAPWLLPAGDRRSGVAQSIDIFPTLLDLVGLPSLLDQFEGQSLATSSSQFDPTVYMENLCQGFVGVRRGRFKLVISQGDSQLNQYSQTPKILTEKLMWRLRLLKNTVYELLPARWRCQTDRKPVYDVIEQLAPWWRAKGEPEEIFLRLMEHGSCALYDLFDDPLEQNNIALANPFFVSQLKQVIQDAAVHGTKVQPAYSASEEAAVEAHLRALGYF
ncbi:MAG: sulfatase [Candidatus Hodarchaeota archaeon]